MLNLDTHILLHALSDELTAKERRTLAREEWSISAICLWEISKLHQLGRINLGLSHPLMQRALKEIKVWEISAEVCAEIDQLDFKADPADELIAATSICHNVPLLTRDRALLKSKRVPLAI